MKRRQLIKGIMLTSAAIAFAKNVRSKPVQERATTPSEIEGPFYPCSMSLDSNADLTRVQGQAGLAQGSIISVSGTVLTRESQPIAGARIELWQANAFGKYHHPDDTSSAHVDKSFQGYAKLLTDIDGRFGFRSVFPGAYPLPNSNEVRTPHIHFKVHQPGYQSLTTQMYFPNHELNERDPLVQTKTQEAIALMTAREAPKQKPTEREFEWSIVLQAS